MGIDRRAKTKIINAGIKKSAEESAKDFWAYNNGITALTHSYMIEHNCLKCRGISIINGAQTTGSIGSLANQPSEDLFVSIRVIECTDNNTIKAIIDNNNKQNEMLPSDFRSNDSIQKRLRKDFQKYSNLLYSGGLRKNQSIRGKEVFDHFLVGQTLLAFHGDPVTAYSSKTEIWSNDKLYGRVFDENLSAEHIILVYSLSRMIDQVKINLTQKKKDRTITDKESKWLEYLGKRGSRILLLSAISMNLEIIMDTALGNLYNVGFKDNSNFEQCKILWHPIINMVLAFCEKLKPALTAGGLDSKEKSKEVVEEVGSIISYVKEVNGGVSNEIRGFLEKIQY